MDRLGERIISDTSAIDAKLVRAQELEREAGRLRREAAEMERLLQLAMRSPV